MVQNSVERSGIIAEGMWIINGARWLIYLHWLARTSMLVPLTLSADYKSNIYGKLELLVRQLCTYTDRVACNISLASKRTIQLPAYQWDKRSVFMVVDFNKFALPREWITFTLCIGIFLLFPLPMHDPFNFDHFTLIEPSVSIHHRNYARQETIG